MCFHKCWRKVGRFVIFFSSRNLLPEQISAVWGGGMKNAAFIGTKLLIRSSSVRKDNRADRGAKPMSAARKYFVPNTALFRPGEELVTDHNSKLVVGTMVRTNYDVIYYRSPLQYV